jgi:hypothetical protein
MPFAHMEPNIIIAESPDLIGVGKRNANDQLAIAAIVADDLCPRRAGGRFQPEIT